MSDVPTGMLFVDPDEVQTTYRICIAGEPGDGKTIAAATAPGPLLVLNADRPSAWQVARRRNPGKEIRETRYIDHTSLEDAYRYLGSPEGADIATFVIDPWSDIYDQLVAAAPKVEDSRTHELKPDYEMVHSKLMRFLKSLRRFDVHVVIVAHLKENEAGKKADGKTYARFGGMGLIRKAMAEMDVVALIRRTEPDEGEPTWFAEIQPTDVWAGKDGTDSLGPRRVADVTRWIELARAANAPTPSSDDDDLPWVRPEAGSGPTSASPDDAEGGFLSDAQAARTPSQAGPGQEAGPADSASAGSILDGRQPAGSPEDDSLPGGELTAEQIAEAFGGVVDDSPNLPLEVLALLAELERHGSLAKAAAALELAEPQMRALRKQTKELLGAERDSVVGLITAYTEWQRQHAVAA